MENKVSGNKLLEKLLDVKKYGLYKLKKILIPIIILYISINPHVATIFLIEYFKIDPEMALVIIQYSFPLLIGIIMARVISILWVFPFRYILVIIVIIIFMPAILILKYYKMSYLNKFNNWIKQLDDKFNNKRNKETCLERELLIINRFSALIFVFGLFFAQFYDNAIGELWNPSYNKKLSIMTNVHYYCQVTGSYNVEQCRTWKLKLLDYNRKQNLNQTSPH